jgi:acyl-CoA synthetase (AMP-forming)/AMP-acid ligase II
MSNMPAAHEAPDVVRPVTMAGLLRFYARTRPDDSAFVFLGEDNAELEELSYADLHGRAEAEAVRLAGYARPGDRAMLLFPSGLAFVVAFFACHYAGVVPVPMMPPRGRRLRDAVFSVARDCRAAVALTTPDLLGLVSDAFAPLEECRDTAFMAIAPAPAGRGRCVPVPSGRAGYFAGPDELAFLQYTSGSTSAPKGVMVSHANLDANLRMMTAAFENTARSTYVGWAPLYHDMGLIANVLEPFFVGARCVLMAPGAFARQPWLWLRAISTYGADVSGGPNYAYDLCVDRRERILREGPDLSGWRLAFNSAEPVRAATVRRFAEAFACLGFRAEAMYPCYGMAEATLLISGGSPCALPVVLTIGRQALERHRADPPAGRDGDSLEIVGCGRALAGEDVRIVDPVTRAALGDGVVGEVWVHGPNIPTGYWGMPDASAETFHAAVAGEPGRRYLRTGDFGFMKDGELFVTGRLKDMMIVRGRNIYPQDVEHIAERAHPGLRLNSAAAFLAGVEDTGREGMVLVQEVERTARRSIDPVAASMAIRRAVFDEFEITLQSIVLVEPGSIPKTSSGKIRRAETRRWLAAGELRRLDRVEGDPLPAKDLGESVG